MRRKLKKKHAFIRLSVFIFVMLVFTILTLIYLIFSPSTFTFTKQENLVSDSDVQLVLLATSEISNNPLSTKPIISEKVDSYGSKTIAVIDPYTYSSYIFWIPGDGVQHDHTVGFINIDNKDIHIISQFSPKNDFELKTSQNFYTRRRVALSEIEIIINIEKGYPIGSIRAYSLATNADLNYITIFTYPLFFSSLQKD